MPSIHDIDPTAPVLEADESLRSFENLRGATEGAQVICEHLEDDDAETWLFTRAGQYVRVTGKEQDRYYVWPEDLARDHLAADLDADLMAKFFAFPPVPGAR